VTSEETADKILRAFLSLAAERGMSAITTRDIAAAAVNEVTVFRHFGDKATLAREAVRRFSPAAGLDAYQPSIDASGPQAAIDGLLGCLAELQARLAGRPELLQFGLGDAACYPGLTNDLKVIPAAARRLLTRAFEQAHSPLRDDISIDAEVIGFLGMLLILATWRSRHWTDLSDEQVTGLLAARLRPLFRSPGDPGRTPPGKRHPLVQRRRPVMHQCRYRARQASWPPLSGSGSGAYNHSLGR